ncbi:unnamed protein product [Somion occarium]|uniref:DNA repair and recombination protein RAD54B n=1 Tax=Somion occarium TaxID=3059160 RepID=A0ABP1DJY5_9APHY
MPSFANPVLGSAQKRKHVEDSRFTQRKRHAGPAQLTTTNNASGSRNGDKYWTVQWRNHQQKKHKTWDGDGVLLLSQSGQCVVFDMESRRIASGKPSGILPSEISLESTFNVGGKDVYVDCEVKREDYLSGRCFDSSFATAPEPANIRKSTTLLKPYVPLRPRTINGFKAPSFLKPNSPAPSNSNPTAARLATPEPVSHVVRSNKSYWSANWRKFQTKKHKTWDGDAFIVHNGAKLTLISDKGIVFGSTKWDGTPLLSGFSGRVGQRQFELDCQISQADMPAVTDSSMEEEPDIDLEAEGSSAPQIFAPSSRPSTPNVVKNETPSKPSSVSAKSFYAHVKPKPKLKGPLHDPNAEGAIVMNAPTADHISKYNKKNAPIVPVVIDPILGRKLRPHQVEGVKFMYECVMGLAHSGNGCILADEMGMGKTLQTVTLVWTLLTKPVCWHRACCGQSTYRLPCLSGQRRDRIGVFVGDKDKAAIKQFINSRIHNVLIIGYERLRTIIDDLVYCVPPIALIICDEGHRLKSASNKTSTMFDALRTPRRVILSGTPIQNDLSEFHAMADFCNPGLLGDYQSFRKLYEGPIMKSRAPDCSSKDKELGDGRLADLMGKARMFVLRRDATILKSYLPPKYEYVVFIAPTKLQRDMFQRILTRDNIDNISATHTAESLALINLLTKISSSPILLKATVDQARSKGGTGDVIKKNAIEDALKLLPEKAQVEDVSLSGKLAALANLLRAIYKSTEEKCIVVSHYTSTLNVIEAFCKKKSYTYLRLDGQTPAAKRQEYVNDFNRSTQSQRFIFLLSSKAGGVGLNLIGASRLCLIDSDWNPSHDLQSMARIHRDGQKRPVFIYRFLTAGTIDEKIFQRQVTKLGLSNSLMGDGKSGSKSDSFSRKDLRDIFTVHPHTACHTHDLLECPCSGDTTTNVSPDILESEDDNECDEEMGFMTASQVKPRQIEKMDKAYLKQKKAQLASLGEWTHINCLKPGARDHIHDSMLQKLLYASDAGKSRQSVAGNQSRPQSILAATDLETMLEDMGPALAMTDVPGGTISFLFERGVKTIVEESDLEISLEDD